MARCLSAAIVLGSLVRVDVLLDETERLVFLIKTPRAKMATYMQSLYAHVGYVSLKTKHIDRATSKKFSLSAWV